MKNMAVCLILLFFSAFTTGTAFSLWGDHPVFESNQAQVLVQTHVTDGLVLVPVGASGKNTTDTMIFHYEVFVPEGKTLSAELNTLYLLRHGENIGNPQNILTSDISILEVEALQNGAVYLVELSIQLQHVTCSDTMALLSGSSVRFSPKFVAK